MAHQYPKSPTGKRLSGPVLPTSLPKLEPVQSTRLKILRNVLTVIAGLAALELAIEILERISLIW